MRFQIGISNKKEMPEEKSTVAIIKDDEELEISTVKISGLIHIVRGKQVILDSDLAELYQVETGAMNRAVKRNKKRFPEDFMFRLTEDELPNSLRSKFASLDDDNPSNTLIKPDFYIPRQNFGA